MSIHAFDESSCGEVDLLQDGTAGVLLPPAPPVAARHHENTNRLLRRQYLPKNADLAAFTQDDLPWPRTALSTRIAAAGAGWLLAGRRIAPALKTFRRAASAAIPHPIGGPVPIGDAALTRDALASQGLSIGLSDARLAADDATSAEHLAARFAEARWRHLMHLTETLSTAGYADRPVWRDYRRWVSGSAVALTNEQAWASARAVGPMPLNC